MWELAQIGQSMEEAILAELAKNSLSAYVTALAILVIGIIVIVCIHRVVIRKLTSWIENRGRYGRVDRKLVLGIVHALLSLFYTIPVYSAFGLLQFSVGIRKILDVFFLLVFTWLLVRFLSNLAVFLVDSSLRRPDDNVGQKKGAGALVPIVRTLVWGLGITFLLDNLGFQVSSIVAGLGIMGVAVGLAGQAILADFFSYIVILLDQPFAIGDTVSLGTITGTVVRIGLKTTRIRLPTGEILICPNGELTKSRVGNQQGMVSRSRTFTFSLALDTPLEQVEQIVPLVEAEAASCDCNITVNRAHLLALTETGLQFEVVISVPGNELVPLLDAQHALNLRIMRRFVAEQIKLACPVRWVQMDTVAR